MEEPRIPRDFDGAVNDRVADSADLDPERLEYCPSFLISSLRVSGILLGRFSIKVIGARVFCTRRRALRAFVVLAFPQVLNGKESVAKSAEKSFRKQHASLKEYQASEGRTVHAVLSRGQGRSNNQARV